MPKELQPLGSLLILARVPTMRGWPAEAGDAPFYRPQVPTMKTGATLASTAETIVKTETESKSGNNKKKPAGQNKKNDHFIIRMIRNATDTTMKMELAAISNLTVPDDDMSNFGYLSRFLVDFRGPVLQHRLYDLFPIFKDVLNTDLAAAEDSNLGNPEELQDAPVVSERTLKVRKFRRAYDQLDSDQQALFRDMQSLPFGLLIVHSVPGAGKTHVMRLIMLMCCCEPIKYAKRHKHIDQMADDGNYDDGPDNGPDDESSVEDCSTTTTLVYRARYSETPPPPAFNPISLRTYCTKTYREYWKILIFKIISDADMVVGTTKAAKKIADNPEIDEGKNRTFSQSGLHKPKDSKYYFVNQFVPQLSTSILHRMDERH
ncbi:hypothetical protein PG995_015997 [Apiospora arundinis]